MVTKITEKWKEAMSDIFFVLFIALISVPLVILSILFAITGRKLVDEDWL